MRRIIGYTLLVISCVAFCLMAVIPFLDLESADKAAWLASMFIFAEVTWWLAMPLLGKEIIDASKRWWRKSKQWLFGEAKPEE